MIPSRLYTTLPLFLSISLLAGCEQSSISGEEASPRPVKSVTTQSEREVVESLPGVVRARIETDLAFRTLGRIVSRKVDVGDLVRKKTHPSPSRRWSSRPNGPAPLPRK